jgi:serine/threonine-protein kinase RsbW
MSRALDKIFSLTLKSKPKEVIKVEKFLYEVNNYIRLGEMQFHNLLVATTEAVNNSITHGNQRNPKKKVIVTCKVTKSSIEVKVHDEGLGITEQELPDPLDEKNLLRENGRGIFLMRHLMDSVKFNHAETGSEVIMRMKKKNKV